MQFLLASFGNELFDCGLVRGRASWVSKEVESLSYTGKLKESSFSLLNNEQTNKQTKTPLNILKYCGIVCFAFVNKLRRGKI